jgi:hypothetical protein
MNPIALALGVFALLFAGSLFGMFLRRALPDDHFGPDAKDTVRLAIGLIVTMTGLVLGMLVSSAKTYYDSQKSRISEMSSQILIMDYLLRVYGPETHDLRIEAHQLVEAGVDRIWPREASRHVQLKPQPNQADFYQDLQTLVPKNEAQAAIRAQASAAALNLRRTNSLMYLESVQSSVSVPLLVCVTSWLLAIFVSFGAFAPRNYTVVTTLIVCAVAVSGAIFIIMAMYSPFSGILQISPSAVRDALAQMGTN